MNTRRLILFALFVCTAVVWADPPAPRPSPRNSLVSPRFWQVEGEIPTTLTIRNADGTAETLQGDIVYERGALRALPRLGNAAMMAGQVTVIGAAFFGMGAAAAAMPPLPLISTWTHPFTAVLSCVAGTCYTVLGLATAVPHAFHDSDYIERIYFRVKGRPGQPDRIIDLDLSHAFELRMALTRVARVRTLWDGTRTVDIDSVSLEMRAGSNRVSAASVGPRGTEPATVLWPIPPDRMTCPQALRAAGSGGNP